MTKPIVFTDFHHAGLLNSLILLFEKRLGGQVYRPIGVEWANEGFWKVYDHPATIQQFLGVGGATPDGTRPLNEVIELKDGQPSVAGLYRCQDIDSGKFNKAITLSTFYRMPIDIVVASIPAHVEPFKKLCELHPNKPKLIFQIGNAWTTEAAMAPNVMASAVINGVPENINFISYHQEFDIDIFKPNSDITPGNNIFSFVNCFNVQPNFAHDFELFEKVEQLLPDWDFKAYGGQCRDGAAHGSLEVADKMRSAKFIWHTKDGGDGYGHVIHTAMACGKPLICKKSQYLGKLAEPLLIDNVTCIDIDNLSAQEVVDKINQIGEEKYLQMCGNVVDNFKKVVDFDKEEIQLRDFLKKLV